MALLGLQRTAKTGRTLVSFLCSTYPELITVRNFLQNLDEDDELPERVASLLKKLVERNNYMETYSSFLFHLFSGSDDSRKAKN